MRRRGPELESEKHTVIIVHGTFAAPSESELAAVGTEGAPWYLPGGDFSERLNAALALTPMGDAVWRDAEIFHWSGENAHSDRLAAGEALAERLLALREAQPSCRIHLVAHSHGGNVVLAGLDAYFRRLRGEAGQLASVLADTLDHDGDPAPELKIAFDRVFKATGPMHLARLDRVAPGFRNFLAREFNPAAQRDGLDRTLKALRHVEDALRRIVGVLVTLMRVLLRVPFAPIRDGQEVLIDERLQDAWTSSRENHRLGRVVLLGTPFLHQRPRRMNRVGRWLSGLASRIAVFVVFAVAGFLLVNGVGILLSALPRVIFTGWDPRAWHGLEVLAWCIIVLPSLFVSGAPPKRASNLYFDTGSNPLVQACHGRLDRRLDMLVVTAQQLDEALLGLSARPAVYAYMTPHIKNLLTPRFGVSPLAAPATGEALGTAVLRLVEWAGGALARNLVTLVVWLPLAPLRSRLISAFTDKLVTIVSAASLGVPAGEMNDVDVEVSGDPRTDGAMLVETWSTARLLAGLQLVTAEQAGENEARYRFVWNDAALNQTSSDTWLKVQQHKTHILRRFQYDHDVTLFTADLKRTCATLDERVKEVTGSVSLTHSAYYGHDRVITRIAGFLAYGGMRV